MVHSRVRRDIGNKKKVQKNAMKFSISNCIIRSFNRFDPDPGIKIRLRLRHLPFLVHFPPFPVYCCWPVVLAVGDAGAMTFLRAAFVALANTI